MTVTGDLLREDLREFERQSFMAIGDVDTHALLRMMRWVQLARAITAARTRDEWESPIKRLTFQHLAQLLDELPPPYGTLIVLRFGLLPGELPWKLEAVGKDLGLTRERVRQKEGIALRMLRKRALDVVRAANAAWSEQLQKGSHDETA